MAHKWIDIPTKGLEGLSIYGKRKCERCGAVQKKEAEHLWMRVTGYRWYPLVGRCPSDRKGGKK